MPDRGPIWPTLAKLALCAVMAGVIAAALIFPVAGGLVDIQGKTLAISPTGEFTSEREVGDVIVGSSRTGAPLYLRDLVEVVRTYESPARYLNFFTWRDPAGRWGPDCKSSASVRTRRRR